MNRSGTRLEQEGKQGQQNAQAVKQAATRDDGGKDMRCTRGTVNESDTVKEDDTEDGTGNEVLEGALVCIHVFAAESHQGINRETGKFHAQVESQEVNGLGHQKRAGGCKHQQAVSFTTLELFMAESPLEARNAQESAQDNRYTEHAANRVHGIQIHERVVRRQVVGTGSKRDKEACHPRQHLVLVFVFDERFCGKRHQGACSNQNHGQKINDITHV